MGKIESLDFANYVRVQKEKLVRHCNNNGKLVTNAASLSDIVDLNNTINLDEESPNRPKRRIYNYDGTLIREESIVLGDPVTVPEEAPSIDDPLIEFDRWTKNEVSETIVDDYDVGALVRVKEQINVDGTLVRPTILKICISSASGLSPSLRWKKKTTAQVLYIDWGDGATPDIINSGTSGITSHTYNADGNYNIKIYSTDMYGFTAGGSSFLLGSAVYNKVLQRVYSGDNFTLEGSQYAFYKCSNLRVFTFSTNMYYNYVQSSQSSAYLFANCINLQSIIIPDNFVGKIPNNFLTYDIALKCIIFSPRITVLDSSSIYGAAIEHIKLPTSAVLTNNPIFNCVNLKKLVIPDMPAGATGVTRAFGPCIQNNMEYLRLPTNVTDANLDMGYSSKLEDIIVPANFINVTLKGYVLKTATILNPTAVVGGTNSGGAYSSVPNLEIIYFPNGCNTNLSLSGLNLPSLTDEGLVHLASALFDLTDTSAKTLSMDTLYKVRVDNIYVDDVCEVVSPDTTGAMTLTEFITNKNWTISVTNY